MILVPVLLFFAVLAALSLWTERRRSLPLEETGGGAGFSREYFLGSRSLQGVVLAMTLTATYGSVSTFVSGPGIAWNLGLGWVVFAAPQIIAGFFILGLLGKKMALVSRAVGAVTVVDLLRARFRSPVFATLAALSMLVFFTTMMVGQFAGGAAIFAEVTGGSTIQGLLLFGLLTVFYTTFGGFRAVAVTDALCALLMVLGMVLLAGDIVSEAGGFAEAMRAAAAASPDAEAYLSFDAGGALPLSLLLSAWILVGFGTAGLPQSAVRCMSYRSTEDLHRAMWVSTVVCGALMIGMTLIGVLARGVFAVSPESLGTTDRMIPRLIAEHMSPVAAGITLIGPLAATMSTVSSLLIAASSAVVKDLLLNARPEWAAPGNERRLRFAAKGTTLVLGLAATLFAIDPPDLIAWINLAAFAGLELTFLLPLAAGLFWRRANSAGALAGAILGVGFYGVLLVWKPDLAGWHPIVPAFAVSILAFVAGSFLGRPEAPERLRYFFPNNSRNRRA